MGQESSTSSNGTTSHAPQPHKKPPPPPAVDPLVLKKPEDTISFKNEAKHVVKIERRDSDVEMNTHPPPSNPPPPKSKTAIVEQKVTPFKLKIPPAVQMAKPKLEPVPASGSEMESSSELSPAVVKKKKKNKKSKKKKKKKKS